MSGGSLRASGCSPLSLLTFFAAAKKVSAAPHRGNASKPKTKQGKAKTPKNNNQKRAAAGQKNHHSDKNKKP
jgi:general secretion pathway protein K